jgi:hypothetical protein
MATKKNIPLPNNHYRKINGEVVTACEIKGPLVVDLVRAGMNPSRAGEAVGVSKSTVSVWITRGIKEQANRESGVEPNQSEQVYLEFAEGLAKAESESMGALVLSWFKEARAGDWKAAERFLARRFPQEWGDNNTVKLEVSAGAGFGNNDGRDKELTATEDEERKRAILSALVESGDLPSNVLNAWDDEEADIIDAEIVEPKE